MTLLISCSVIASKRVFAFGVVARLGQAPRFRNRIRLEGDVVDVSTATPGRSTTLKALPVGTAFFTWHDQQES